jgi:hypothetical protein
MEQGTKPISLPLAAVAHVIPVSHEPSSFVSRAERRRDYE